jgi:hypothetical protein
MAPEAEDRVVELLADRKLVVFIGAGVCRPLGLPGWSELISALCADCGLTPSGNHLADAELCKQKMGKEALVRRLAELLRLPAAPEEKWSVLYAIAALSPPILYSTNFDGSLEEAFRRVRRPLQPIVTIDDLQRCPHGAEILVKYHGDVGTPDSIVLAQSDYDERCKIEGPLDIRLRADLLGKGVLFLGYGFSDPNVEAIWTRHLELYGRRSMPDCYLVAIGRDEEKARRLANLGIHVIPIDVSDDRDAPEFREFVMRVHRRVYGRNIGKQITMLGHEGSNSLPVLIAQDLIALREALSAATTAPNALGEEIRRTLELVLVPEGMRKEVLALLHECMEEGRPQEVRTSAAVVLARAWKHDPESIVLLLEQCSDSEIRDLVFPMLSTDLGDAIVGAVIAVLAKAHAERRRLSLDHLERLLWGIRVHRDRGSPAYRELVDKDVRALFRHFLGQHGEAAQARFDLPTQGRAGSDFLAELKTRWPRAARR